MIPPCDNKQSDKHESGEGANQLRTNPPDSLNLIPDSLNLIPEDIRQNSVGVSTRVPFQEIVKLYHETLPELPKLEVLTDARKGYIRQRWLNDLKTLDEWKHYFQHVRNSDFLMGKTSAKDRRPFRASLEWLTRPANFAKVAEDFYHG